jgi:hypothetical protein
MTYMHDYELLDECYQELWTDHKKLLASYNILVKRLTQEIEKNSTQLHEYDHLYGQYAKLAAEAMEEKKENEAFIDNIFKLFD